MKKLIQLLTLAFAGTLALTACTSDETVELNQGTPIRFLPSVGTITRAVTDVDGTNIDSVYVYATNNGTPIFSPTTALKINRNGTFADGQTRYWPSNSDAELEFQALNIPFNYNGYWNNMFYMAPVNNNKVTINIPQPYNMYDVCYAYNKGKREDINNTEGINLDFQHILSKVTFQVKNSDNNSIEIIWEKYGCAVLVGPYISGNFTFPSSQNVTSSNWEVNDGNRYESPYENKKAPFTVTDSYTTIADCFIIPQTLNSTATPSIKDLYFEYTNLTIKNKADNSVIYEGGLYFPLPVGFTLEPGKHYIFKIDLAKGGYKDDGNGVPVEENPLDPDSNTELNPLKFDITVTSWDESDSNNKELTVGE